MTLSSRNEGSDHRGRPDRGRADRGNRRLPPRHRWTIPVIIAGAAAVIVFVAVVLAASGRSFF